MFWYALINLSIENKSILINIVNFRKEVLLGFNMYLQYIGLMKKYTLESGMQNK